MVAVDVNVMVVFAFLNAGGDVDCSSPSEVRSMLWNHLRRISKLFGTMNDDSVIIIVVGLGLGGPLSFTLV
eukprot:1967790-Amphidinium_carterae.2